MKIVQSVLERLPYIIAFLTGIVLFVFASSITGKFSDLVLNVSASLITIPLILYSYERVQDKLKKYDNQDLSRYVKMQLDDEILSILGSLSPVVIKEHKSSFHKTGVLLQLDEIAILERLKAYSPMAFYLATDWSVNEDRISELLSNEMIHNDLSVKERNIFIRLIKALRLLDRATVSNFYNVDGESEGNLVVVKGTDFDPYTAYSNRYLLMERSSPSKGVVVAFSDIKPGKFKGDLLTPMKVNQEGRGMLVHSITEILHSVDEWLESRDNELIINERRFRMVNTELHKR